MLIKNQRDFAAGLLFMVIGIAFALGAKHYDVGTASQMGPGYFPIILGTILGILGVWIAFSAVKTAVPDGNLIGAIAWRPLFFIIFANIVFGTMLKVGLGFILSIYALVFIASAARAKVDIKATFILATVLAVGSYLLFIKLLGLTIQPWPAF